MGAALFALLIGLACYQWWRPMGMGPPLIVGSTPAFTHAFAFALLLSLAAGPLRDVHQWALLGAWLGLLVAFEGLQHDAMQPWLTTLVQREHMPLRALLQAHGAGTFDLKDVLASALGVALAARFAPSPTRPTDAHAS